ncbi:Ig-like domain-containing protein [Paenibacillus sp. GYB003]|uniref:Ig-like domain-containing protein n=1 Tax=Paenibacillus sp. GYB003 TaxID=2994392 RepID=UPI002F964F82
MRNMRAAEWLRRVAVMASLAVAFGTMTAEGGIAVAQENGSAAMPQAAEAGKGSPPRSTKFGVELPETAGVGQYVTVPMTMRGSEATEKAGDVHIVVEKLSGEGEAYWAAFDRAGAPVDFIDSGVYMPDGFPLPKHEERTVDWTVKFTKTGEYAFAFKIADAQGRVWAVAEKTVSVVPSFADLGPQVFQDGIYRGEFGTENGRAVGYTVITGKPDSRFVVLDIATEKVAKQYDLPEAEGAWSIKRASDGKVYIGTYTSAKLFRYDPAAGSIEDMGSPYAQTGGAILYEMAEDRDGNLYYGSYPGGKLFKFDPVAKQTTDLGGMSPGQPYARSIAYDAGQHALFVGAGGNKASLVKYDLATGTKTELLPESIRGKYKLTYDLNLVGDKLFLKMDPNYGLIVIDKNSGQVVRDFGTLAIHSRGVSEKSPYSDTVYLTYGGILKAYDLSTNSITDLTTASGKIDFKANTIGWGIVRLDDPDYPGYTLVGFNGNTGGGFFKYNLTNKTLRITNVTLPKVAIKLHTLGAATNGSIYAAGFLPGGMGIFNPDDRTSTNHSIGQVEGMTALGGRMYFGVYPGAKIYEYDTTKPWKISGSGLTVVNRFELKSGYMQDRPYAMLGVPELNQVFIGTVPDYAVSGGALTVYDPSAGTVSYQVYRNIVQDQSVVALAYKDGKLYGGTSYRGGLGAEWPYADGKLFVYDVASRAKEAELVPVPGKGSVNELIVGPDGNIWGFAQGTFFVYDPVQRRVIHTDDAFPEASGTFRDAEMEVSVKDGDVYGTIGGDNLFKIDKTTRAITVLRKGASLLAQDRYGNFYFKLKENETSLWRYTVEDRTAAVRGVVLDRSEADLRMGRTLTVTASVYPSFASNPKVVWSTGNGSVATVNAAGVVTPVSPGTATITAESVDGAHRASITVRVLP